MLQVDQPGHLIGSCHQSIVGVFKLSYPPGQTHKQVTLLTKSSGQDSLGLLCSIGNDAGCHGQATAVYVVVMSLP